VTASSICSPVGSLQSNAAGHLAHQKVASNGTESSTVRVSGPVVDVDVVDGAAVDGDAVDGDAVVAGAALVGAGLDGAAVVAADDTSVGSSPHAATTRARDKTVIVAALVVVVRPRTPSRMKARVW